MALSKIAIGAIISRARINSTPLVHLLRRISSFSLPSTRKKLLLSQPPPPLRYKYTRLGMPCNRSFHDGRPRGPLWRGKKMIGKEALFVILGLKRFKDGQENLEKFIKTHVLRLLKMDMITVLNELERQQEVTLAVQEQGLLYYQHCRDLSILWNSSSTSDLICANLT